MAEAEEAAPGGNEQAAANVQDIRVLTTGKTLKIEPFKIPDNHLEIGRAWQEWLEDFEEETTYFEIDKVRDKISALKIYGGQEVKKLARNLPDPAPVEGDDDYEKLKRKLGNHFLPKKNKHHARYTFSKQRMEPGESMVTYTARMREKAKDCEFGDQINDRILEHLIQTIKDNDLIKKCIHKRWNLDQFIEEASQREDISQQVKDMKDEHKVARVHQQLHRNQRGNRRVGGRHVGQPKRPQDKQHQRYDNKQEARRDEKSCDYCGKTDAHKPGQNCPAYGKQCLKCGKYNHFAVCCKGGQKLQEKQRSDYRQPGGMHKRHVRTAEAEETSSESDNDYLYQTAQRGTPRQES